MKGEAAGASIDTEPFCYAAVYGDRDKRQGLMLFVLERDANKIIIEISICSFRPEPSQVMLTDKRRKCERLLPRWKAVEIRLLKSKFAGETVEPSSDL
jgi:hypothetical protein